MKFISNIYTHSLKNEIKEDKSNHSFTSRLLSFFLSQDFNRIPLLWQQHGFHPDDTWSTSVHTDSSPTEKETRPLKPICLTPILPRTKSGLHGPAFTSPDSLPGQPLQTSTPVQVERCSRVPGMQSGLLVNSELSAFRPCKRLEEGTAKGND